ncbi:Kynurenine formamidase bacterial [Paramagnetospirillum magnetotacticum MS-1]|uniref:Kynurenine formamidase n=1 Tax=Paramagnetospirillum magnetotacticum MS-1 TaxID=272627 RepID=A0A0C2YRN4_PARME|nr:cyclase family protein [Paramagnetospirillum magnetotacticum]KIL97793.1 Kynurenine formamidase bacterial [Paramagnetospirillum magnetotacticum MS-1]
MIRRFDLTLPFGAGVPAWPGEPLPILTRLSDMDNGDACNVTRLNFAVHYGTHLDAPIHFIRDGADVASLALDVLMGPCSVVHVPDHVAEIGPAELEALAVPPGCERLLLATRNSALWNQPNHPFFTDFIAFTPAGAQWLVERGIKLVGIDYLSVQRFADAEPTTHRVLLGAGIVAVEGLDMRGIDPGEYELVCLPLKLIGADGSPCRVVLTRNS